MSYASAGLWGGIGQGLSSFGEAIQKALNNVRYREEREEEARRYTESYQMAKEKFNLDREAHEADLIWRDREGDRGDRQEALGLAQAGATRTEEGEYQFNPQDSWAYQLEAAQRQLPLDEYQQSLKGYYDAQADRARREPTGDQTSGRQREAAELAFRNNLIGEIQQLIRGDPMTETAGLSEDQAYRQVIGTYAPLFGGTFPQVFQDLQSKIGSVPPPPPADTQAPGQSKPGLWERFKGSLSGGGSPDLGFGRTPEGAGGSLMDVVGSGKTLPELLGRGGGGAPSQPSAPPQQFTPRAPEPMPSPQLLPGEEEENPIVRELFRGPSQQAGVPRLQAGPEEGWSPRSMSNMGTSGGPPSPSGMFTRPPGGERQDWSPRSLGSMGTGGGPPSPLGIFTRPQGGGEGESLQDRIRGLFPEDPTEQDSIFRHRAQRTDPRSGSRPTPRLLRHNW